MRTDRVVFETPQRLDLAPPQRIHENRRVRLHRPPQVSQPLQRSVERSFGRTVVRRWRFDGVGGGGRGRMGGSGDGVGAAGAACRFCRTPSSAKVLPCDSQESIVPLCCLKHLTEQLLARSSVSASARRRRKRRTMGPRRPGRCTLPSRSSIHRSAGSLAACGSASSSPSS